MLRSALPTLLIACLAAPAWSAQFYRWVDADGNTFIQSFIPPEYVAGGYEIIDDSGNVIRTVAPQLSEAERRKLEADAISEEMQRARDEELLKLYRSPADVDRAMRTWTSRMDMEIRVKRNRIRIKENEFDTLQARAANQEKAGQEVDAELLAQMKGIRLQIQAYELEIQEVELRQAESRAAFYQDRERMIELWEQIHGEKWVEPEKADNG